MAMCLVPVHLRRLGQGAFRWQGLPNQPLCCHSPVPRARQTHLPKPAACCRRSCRASLQHNNIRRRKLKAAVAGTAPQEQQGSRAGALGSSSAPGDSGEREGSGEGMLSAGPGSGRAPASPSHGQQGGDGTEALCPKEQQQQRSATCSTGAAATRCEQPSPGARTLPPLPQLPLRGPQQRVDPSTSAGAAHPPPSECARPPPSESCVSTQFLTSSNCASCSVAASGCLWPRTAGVLGMWRVHARMQCKLCIEGINSAPNPHARLPTCSCHPRPSWRMAGAALGSRCHAAPIRGEGSRGWLLAFSKSGIAAAAGATAAAAGAAGAAASTSAAAQ